MLSVPLPTAARVAASWLQLCRSDPLQRFLTRARMEDSLLAASETAEPTEESSFAHLKRSPKDWFFAVVRAPQAHSLPCPAAVRCAARENACAGPTADGTADNGLGAGAG
eukprot:SAG11_NODE_1353_length_5128_cov_3.658183_7_plen_110_part_00